jgi:predicted kinase
VSDASPESQRAQRLILFSGLPGTGKSTLAEAVGRALGITVLEKDRVEAAVVLAGIARIEPGMASLGPAGYTLFFALVERQLELGLSVIADCTAPSQRLRDAFSAMSARHGAELRALHCVCANAQVHRARVETRMRAIPGWRELTWADVERSRADFEPWRTSVLTIDAADAVDLNIARARAYVTPEAGGLLRAIDAGGRLRDHRDIEGVKRFALYDAASDADHGQPIDAALVHLLVDADLLGSNQKFPVATYWLTATGRAWIAQGWAM